MMTDDEVVGPLDLDVIEEVLLEAIEDEVPLMPEGEDESV